MRAICPQFMRVFDTQLENLPILVTVLPLFVADFACVACVTAGACFYESQGRTHMDLLQRIKEWIGSLTEIGLMLLALAIVAALLVGANLPFFGNVTNNIMDLVKSLGDGGLVGLITLGVILWLFSGRKTA
jgi:hypothetical protein